MSPFDASPQEIIQAAAVTPSFIGAYRTAPPSIRVGEKTYERDAARTASERVWYLAACAMQNPRAVYDVGNQGLTEMALAFDETEVELDSKVAAAKDAATAAKTKLVEAEKAVDDARKARDKAKRETGDVQQKIAAGEAEIRSLEAQIADVGRIKDFGDGAAALFTMGATKIAPWADLQIRLEQMKKHTAQERQNLAALPSLTNAEQELKAAQQRARAAKVELGKAESAVASAEESVRKRLRDAEEKTRQEEARKKSEEAAERAREAAAERQRQAEDAWNQQNAGGGGDPSGEYYGDTGGGDYIEPEWQGSDWATTDPDAELGDPEYLDEVDDMADVYGDEDYGAQMTALTDDFASPYSIDGYYQGYDLEQDPVFGADTGQIVTGIIAGVLAAAPAIINAVAPPPSKDASGADTNVGAGKLGDSGEQGKMPPASSSSGFNVDDLLAKIGLKKTINDAAAAAGGSAGKQGGQEVTGTVTGYVMAAGFIGLAVFIATR